MKKKKFTYIILSLWLVCLFSMLSCEFHINTDDDCIKCSYKHNGGTVSEEFCDPLISDDDRAEIRMRMQIKADSLMTTLTCKEY